MAKSNILLLNGGMYSYELPPLPPEREIWYHDVKKSEQYWKTPQNKDFRWLNPNGTIKDVRKISSERDKVEYINYWRDKWLNGMWVMIKGEPVYFPGMYVDHLIFATYNSQKLLFFRDELECFCFRDHTRKAPLCDGRTWIKPRRAKLTTQECTEAQYTILEDFSNFVTIQSDTLDKAQKSFMSPIIDSYSKRPVWMREEYYAPNGKKPRKSLELSSNVIQDEDNEWLGGKINIFPTIPKATDGLEAALSIIDEFSKIEDVSPYEIFEVNRKVTQNFRKKGMNDALSSTGDSKDAAKATMDWHKLIANSNPKILDQFGKTISGNWEYFISAIHSQYVPKEFTDKYGDVNKEKAEEWIWNEHRKYQDGTKERIFSLYKLPLKKEHALLSSATSNLFNKLRISSRLTELEGLPIDRKPYIRSSLIEKDGMIYKEPDPLGVWLWSLEPYFSNERNIDTRNRFIYYNGIYQPPINPEGAIGYDTINYPKLLTSSNSLSQACITIHKKFDYFNSKDSVEYHADEKMAFLLWRPDDPHEVNRECIKACKFLGYPVMHERSVSHVYEDFEKYGMLPFLLQDEAGIYGISQSNMTAKRDGIAMLQSRYSAPKTEGQVDQIATYPFEDGLRSLRDFDPNNTTPFDPTMSEIMLEHGLKQVVYTNLNEGNVSGMVSRVREIVAPRNHLINS